MVLFKISKLKRQVKLFSRGHLSVYLLHFDLAYWTEMIVGHVMIDYYIYGL